MKMKKNKIFMMLICLVTILTNVNITTFASTTGDYKNLLDKGFSVNQINHMPSSLFEKLNRSGYTNVSKEEKYYRITYNKETHEKTSQEFTKQNYKSQYTKDLKAKERTKSLDALQIPSLVTSKTVTIKGGFIEVDWLRLTTHIDYYGPDNSYELSNFYEWTTTPSFRVNDVLGIGISENFSPIPDTQFFSAQYNHYHYDVTNGPSTVTEYVDKTRQDQSGSGGMGFYYDLPSDFAGSYGVRDNYTGFMGYMTFSCNLNENVAPTFANAYGNYSHEQTGLTLTPSLKYPLGGVLSLSWSSRYDKVFTNCQATVN
jgi:hypothetical protein